MIITYYGASCFKVQSGETVLAFDPPSKDSKIKTPRFSANVTLISHNHTDHNGYDVLAGDPLIIEGPGEYEVSGVFVTGVKTYHDSEKGAKYGLNTTYSVKFENMNICHLGDFGEKELRPEVEEIINEADILFVPIGGESVMSIQDAEKIIARISPKIVIPMHYENETILKAFLKEFNDDGTKKMDKLTLKKKDLPESMEVVVITQT